MIHDRDIGLREIRQRDEAFGLRFPAEGAVERRGVDRSAFERLTSHGGIADDQDTDIVAPRFQSQ